MRLLKSTHIFKTISACLSVHAVGSNLEVIPHLSGDRGRQTAVLKKPGGCCGAHVDSLCDVHKRRRAGVTRRGNRERSEVDVAGLGGQSYSFYFERVNFSR